MDRATFFDRLRQSRLLTEAELEQAVSRFGDDAPSQAIADVLVQEGMLTAFQSRQVCNGDTQPLSLGQYRLLDELGRGGMGRVYKALHTIMDRVVAIKVISPELVSDPVAVEWFRREVRASTQLNHPNIVMAYDANEANGLHFLVMEYVHGVTLDALVKKNGPLPVAHACALIRQAALGMQHAHDKGMVHRDIKPGNLLIPLLEGDQPSDVLVKILDFGLARLQGKTKGETIAVRGETGVLGTPDYIAPEQSRDIHAADIRSDLYSLGCVFYFALAGRVPFAGDNAMEKLIKHLMEYPEPLEKVSPDLPQPVAAIVRRLMAKDPADRYQTPAELVRELESWAEEHPKLGPAARTSARPLWISPPTQAPSAGRPATSLQRDQTCILDRVEVFSPLRKEAELSGPSLLEPVWKYAPGEQRQPDTHDTVSLSHVEETADITAAARAIGKNQTAAASHQDSDATFQDMAEPGKTRASSGGELPPIDRVVSRLWRRWRELVETIVAGRGPSRVDDNTYRTIHGLLLQACREAIEACHVPERRAFYEECLSIAQPWLKLKTFAHTEASILESLLERCGQIEVELNDGTPPWTIRQVLGFLLLALSPAGAALWYWYYGRLWLPALVKAFNGEFSTSSLRSGWDFLLTHPAMLMGVIFPLVIVFSLSLLSRPPRA
ncbi:MAG TPA: protein kinase [Gemmataceae bacterium]|nr:protein kinase [Gemmataceae bacterium]